MKCLFCQAENKIGAKFCAKCGQMAALPAASVTASRTCTVCQNACKPDARFCPKCGTGFDAPGLVPVAPASVVAPVSAAALTSEPATQDIAPSAVEYQPIASTIADEPPAPVSAEPATLIVPTIPSARVEPATANLPDSIPQAAKTAPPQEVKAPRTGKPIALFWLATVAGIAVLTGGAYFAMRTSDTPVTATVPAKTASTVTPPVAASVPSPVPPTPPVAPPSPAEPAPVARTPEPPEIITEAAPAKPAPVVTAKPKPVLVPVARVTQPTSDSGIEQVINDSLTEASQCMGRKQFDCVIANTSTVLRMAPGNRRALDLKRQAREAQEKALSQIQIQ